MYIDIFLGFFVLIGLVQGYHRGIIRTVFAIAAVILGLLAALKFSPLVVNLFDEVFDWDPMLDLVLGLALTFVLIMWGIKWLGKSFEKTLKMAKLNFINRILGAALYAGLMVVIYASIIWFLNRTEVIPDHQKEQSHSYVYLEIIPKYGEAVFNSVKPVFKGFWDKIEAITENGDPAEEADEVPQ